MCSSWFEGKLLLGPLQKEKKKISWTLQVLSLTSSYSLMSSRERIPLRCLWILTSTTLFLYKFMRTIIIFPLVFYLSLHTISLVISFISHFVSVELVRFFSDLSPLLLFPIVFYVLQIQFYLYLSDKSQCKSDWFFILGRYRYRHFLCGFCFTVHFQILSPYTLVCRPFTLNFSSISS